MEAVFDLFNCLKLTYINLYNVKSPVNMHGECGYGACPAHKRNHMMTNAYRIKRTVAVGNLKRKMSVNK